ncbi:hypothetical protein SAPIO_CDS8023 [Scedosporium apiospermum]|uniref:Mid2 domain-containing protein n=1 Tax=Pseudallescheria apiosperma TaxID=563466 RepID=A0A084G0G6_PSEDA|nr:uncharacterized protein SAPIO_CDS8023 [Scedosporium apiospermum]KEZ40828.1 hypothetical protein SAPIO_CDS8023 [Scedosporium apiospermum]
MHLPWVISLLGLCGLASAIDSNGIFSHPPKSGPSLFYLDNIVLTLGDTEELKWSTGMTSYTLTLWQQFLNGGARGDATAILKKEGGDPEPGGTTWKVQTYGFDLDDSPIFFFGIGFDGSGGSGFTSHYFNITRERPSSTSSSSTSTSSTSSSSGPTSSDSSPAIATSNTDGNSASSASDPSLRLGLGLGLGLGIPLVALISGLISYIVFKKRSARNNAVPSDPRTASYVPSQAEWHTPEGWAQTPSPKPPVYHEMDTPRPVAELPTTNQRG